MKTTLPSLGSLTKNWPLKLLSLILGTCLWYFVVGEDQVDITVNVPIEVHNLPANLVIANQFKKDIEVSVRGPRRKINELRTQNISRPIDLSGATPGTKVIRNDDESITFPKGILVQRLQPTNITLLLDELIKKDFSINPVTEGEIKAGYTLSNIVLDPNHITISGPKALLGREMALKTFIINLDGLDKSTTLQVQLNLNEALQNLIGETVVEAKLIVKENILRKTVRGIPINVRDAGLPVKTIPHMVAVEAGIPENLIRDTPELAMLFRASVNAKDVKREQSVTVDVSGVEVPDHEPIKIISVSPEFIKLVPQKVTIEPLQSQSNNQLPAEKASAEQSH